MSPSWYDLLGVAPDASTEEIRAAWKVAIADLDPTDRRFRLLNQAAEVLLDPAQRADYDRELAPEVAEPEPAAVDLAEEDLAVTPVDTPPEAETLAPEAGEPVDSAARRSVPGWAVVAVAALTAVMLGLAGWLATQPSDQAVADATTEAQGAAENAIAKVLAYDYRQLDENQAAAHEVMTADYRKKYDQFFEGVVRQNAIDTQTVVSIDVVASAIVRANDDRVQVLVFMNTPTTNVQKKNEVYKNQATATMEKVGDQWLLDDLCTQAAGC